MRSNIGEKKEGFVIFVGDFDEVELVLIQLYTFNNLYIIPITWIDFELKKLAKI
jgi:hypothetical protein